MKKSFLKFSMLLVILLLAFLSACSLVSRPAATTLIAIRTPVPELPLFEKALPVQLLVTTPDANDGLKSDRIALLFEEREIKFLADAKWEAPVPVLIQRQIIRYLDATGAFSAVGSENLGLQSRYRLQSDLQRLHLCYAKGEDLPTAEIRLRLSVLDIAQGKILENKTLYFKENAQGNGQDQLIDALDNVIYRAMLDTARWTASLINGLEQNQSLQ
jgi:ABC-type uncharacterized transport system auxiliary subunit